MLLEESPVDRRIDVRGKVCPYPTVEVQTALQEMESGQVLEVVSNYPPARTTIPHLCWNRGYAWVLVQDSDEQFRVRVKKERVPEPPEPPGFR